MKLTECCVCHKPKTWISRALCKVILAYFAITVFLKKRLAVAMSDTCHYLVVDVQLQWQHKTKQKLHQVGAYSEEFNFERGDIRCSG